MEELKNAIGGVILAVVGTLVIWGIFAVFFKVSYLASDFKDWIIGNYDEDV